MKDVDVETDHDELTVTLSAEFDAPIERVWELWADPRKLEQWWGPPDYPATYITHDFQPGGETTYFMTGPDGTKYGGIFRTVSADPPRSLELETLFAESDGTPRTDLPPGRITVALESHEGGTLMRMQNQVDSAEALELFLGTGAREGQRAAIGQMYALLG